jgi:hypothetical protein
MGTKRVAKKKVAKTAAKKPPPKKVIKKKGSHRTAAKPLPKVSPQKATRRDEGESSDDQASGDAPDPHEHVEPRELSHERLLNSPEETATPLPDDDLVDDVAADAEALERSTAEEDA